MEAQQETPMEVSPSASAPPDVSSLLTLQQMNLPLDLEHPRSRASLERKLCGSIENAVHAVLAQMFVSEPAPEEPAAPPTTPRLKAGDGLLRINYALLDSNGIAFGHDLDIPLPGFNRPSMLPMAIKTVQAALSTLVLSPLYGAITDYVEACTASSAHSEVPLPFRLKPVHAFDPESGEQVDLEGHAT